MTGMVHMSLNFLLHRHQISLMREAASASPEARVAHRGLAAGYARRIRDLCADAGAAVVLHVPLRPAADDLRVPSENPDRFQTS